MVGPVYFPILKAKQGELKSLAEWPSGDHSISPVLEIIPWERDDETEDDSAEISKAVERVRKAWTGKAGRLYIDAAACEPDFDDWDSGNFRPVLGSIVQILRRDNQSIFPTIRASSSHSYLRALAVPFRLAGVTEAVVRITAEDLDDTVTPLRDLVARSIQAVGIDPEKVDVIMDFGAVADESATTLAARLARFVLPQLDDGPWRSLAVAGGAFPENLSEIVPNTVGTLRRHDLELWRSVSQLKLHQTVNYSDYAVTHPVLPIGVAFAAPPQLRYTVGDHWLVAKGRRNDRRGHAQFFDICAEVIQRAGSEAARPADSWGDHYIAQAVEMSRQQPGANVGPGNASTWRAIATSHHLALVVRQLGESDEL